MASANLDIQEVSVPATQAVQSAFETKRSPDAIRAALADAFKHAELWVEMRKLKKSGLPRVYYNVMTPEEFKGLVALPIERTMTPAGTRRAFIANIAARKGLRFTHRGSYANLHETYAEIGNELVKRGLAKDQWDWAGVSPVWEEYANSPDNTPEADLVTHIYVTVR